MYFIYVLLCLKGIMIIGQSLEQKKSDSVKYIAWKLLVGTTTHNTACSNIIQHKFLAFPIFYIFFAFYFSTIHPWKHQDCFIRFRFTSNKYKISVFIS